MKSSEKVQKIYLLMLNLTLEKILLENWITAHGVIGFFPANSVGDDIEIYADDDRNEVITKICMLRQQIQKPENKYNLCLADFIAPKESGIKDYIGAFAVTAGGDIEKKLQEFEHDLDDYNSIMLKALADRFAESFAEHMHKRVRREFWRYAPQENLDNEALIAEKYQGIRPAPGYPACPDHTEKPILFNLLQVVIIQVFNNRKFCYAACIFS